MLTTDVLPSCEDDVAIMRLYLKTAANTTSFFSSKQCRTAPEKAVIDHLFW